MGWNNPDVPWAELESVLSGRPRTGSSLTGGPEADGGDSPAWSRKREPYPPPAGPSGRKPRDPSSRTPSCTATPTSASWTAPATPRSWWSRPPGSGLEALALTDHDGMYGVVRFAEAAAELGVAHRVRRGAVPRAARPAERGGRPGGRPPAGARPRPRGVPARCAARSAPRSCAGRRRAARSTTWTRWSPGPPGQVLALTGCRKGAVRRALLRRGRDAGGAELRRLVELVRRPSTWPSSSPTHGAAHRQREQRRAGRAGRRRGPADDRHHRRALRDPGRGSRWPRRWLRCAPGAAWTRPTAGCRPAGTAHLRSGAEMAARFEHRYPGAVARAAELGRSCAFDLRLVAPDLPPFPVPPGHDRGELAARAHPPRRGAALRQPRRVPGGRRDDRARAGDHRGRRTSPATS